MRKEEGNTNLADRVISYTLCENVLILYESLIRASDTRTRHFPSCK